MIYFFVICEKGAGQFFANLNHIRGLNIDPFDVLRRALLYFLEFGFYNPNQDFIRCHDVLQK
jgi:hypothetical protein